MVRLELIVDFFLYFSGLFTYLTIDMYYIYSQKNVNAFYFRINEHLLG